MANATYLHFSSLRIRMKVNKGSRKAIAVRKQSLLRTEDSSEISFKEQTLRSHTALLLCQIIARRSLAIFGIRRRPQMHSLPISLNIGSPRAFHNWNTTSKPIDPGNYLLLLCSLKYRPETNGTGTCIIIVLIFWGGIWNQPNSWTLISSRPHPMANINRKLQSVQPQTKLRTNPLFPRVLFSSLFGLLQSRVPDTNTRNLQIMLTMFQPQWQKGLESS